MNKVLAIVVLLLVVTAGAAMASASNWLVYLNADSLDGTDFGVASQIGVKPLATDGLDATYDGTPVDFGTSSSTTKWAANSLAGDLYPKNFLSTADYTTYPGGEKKWSFRVAGLTTSTGTIRFQFKTSTSTATLVAPASGPMMYAVKLVNNRGMNVLRPSWASNPGASWANGTELTLTIPGTINTFFNEIDLPLLKLSQNANAQMLTEGYEFEFHQEGEGGPITPEPGSLLVLGTGLVGLVGFVAKRRRS